MGKTTSKLHVFRAGKHVAASGEAVEFSNADVEAIAKAYDPKVYKAPFVIGHPKTEDMAYGWVGGLSAESGNLFADEDAEQPTAPEFKEMVNAGRYRNISIAIWPKGHPSSPRPEGAYLKHVGFLGATAPSVKGLTPAHFAADDEKIVTVEFSSVSESETILAKLKSILFPKSNIEPLQAPHFSEDDAMTDEQKTALATREADLKRRETEFAEREAAATKKAKDDAHKVAVATHGVWIDEQVKAGKILPVQKIELSEALASINGATEIEFADNGATVKKSPVEIIKAAIAGKTIDFSEKSKGTPGEGKVIAFRAPDGMQVDQERAKLHLAALEYAEKNKVEYVDAVMAIEQRAKAS